MSGIGIITNPHSKSNKRNPGRAQLLSYIVGKEGFLDVTDSIEDIERAAYFFKENNIKYLAINGGDGTISHTLTSFIKVYQNQPLPKILLLGGGTMNVLAKNLGLKGPAERLLTRLVEHVSTGTEPSAKSLHTIEIESAHGFLYADGTSNLLLEEFYKAKSNAVGGAWLAFKVAISAIFHGRLFRRCIRARPVIFRPKPFAKFEHQTLGTFASTLAFLPLHIPMFGKTLRSDNQFRAVTINLPATKLLFRLPFLAFFSKQGHFWGKQNYDTTELTVSCPEPFRYTLDGEIYTSKNNKVTIRAGKLLDFIVS